MKFSHSIIAVFDTHDGADAAVRALAKSGYALRRLSIVGKGFHTDEMATGFYNNGDRIHFWGTRAALWGGLWGLFMGGLFTTLPVVGGVVLLGHVAAAGIAALEGAVVIGGAGALFAAMASIGVPRDTIVAYESDLAAYCFLVMAHGTSGEMDRAKATLAPFGASRIEVHHNNNDLASVPDLAIQAQVAVPA